MANDYTVVPEDLKKQLALAARSIQWSYAIFWSISSAQPHGELKWGEGYYNGDIKTRKTVQSAELNADQLGLHRSEQLRELFMSLSAGEANPQARRPTAALSPEDLTDTEWYYLVCMSFSFDIGNGLPGRTYANGQINWLCNAHNADSKVFTRSLLAKSASIQTVVCFPFLGGVIELGVTEMVLEDPNLIQHIKTSFLEVPFPIAAANMSTRSNENFAGSAFDHEILESKFVPVIGCEELKAVSLDKISDDQLSDDSFMVEELNGGASLGLMDDDFSNCIPHSMNSSDCISQTIVDPVKAVPVLNSNLFMKHDATDVQDFNQTKLTALDLRSNDLHYQGVLASLLKNSHPLILGPNFRKCKRISSFVSWKKVGLMHLQKSSGNSQSLLKKILIQVPKMYVKGFNESHENKSNRVVLKPETDDVNACHKSLNGKQKGKLIERFSILKSIVPSISKVDEVSILDDTIQYLQKLEKRVEELETCREFTEFEAIRTRRKPQDVIERTSDNYGNNKIGSKLINKRKARDIDEPESEINYNSSKECSSDNVNVSINDKDVLIEIKCPLREGLFLEIMEATSHLKLDSLSVQSSTSDGILSLTIKSKKGYNAVSARTIKQAIQRVAEKC